jgi:uncharacterized protein YciI
MKLILTFALIALTNMTFGQTNIPHFLQGTWKIENSESYEHWDQLNDQTLKGFSYKIENGQMLVSEYLEITQKDNDVVYTATVINQNQGKGIDFKLTRADSVFLFENPDHSFPKEISYQKLSKTEVFIKVSDGKEKWFSYKMIKQENRTPEKDTTISNPAFDKALAEKLGGDEYGMKSYFLVILKTGTNTTADRELISSSFIGHMENIHKLVEEGKLVVAGPLAKNANHYRGIFILNNISDAEEAEALLLTDPAIKNGLLDYEIFTWYGSAALPEYLPVSDKIWKKKP